MATRKTLRQLRSERDRSQVEMAMDLDTTQSQVSRMEGGKHSITLRALREYLRALGVRLVVMYEDEGGRTEIEWEP